MHILQSHSTMYHNHTKVNNKSKQAQIIYPTRTCCAIFLLFEYSVLLNNLSSTQVLTEKQAPVYKVVLNEMAPSLPISLQLENGTWYVTGTKLPEIVRQRQYIYCQYVQESTGRRVGQPKFSLNRSVESTCTSTSTSTSVSNLSSTNALQHIFLQYFPPQSSLSFPSTNRSHGIWCCVVFALYHC